MNPLTRALLATAVFLAAVLYWQSHWSYAAFFGPPTTVRAESTPPVPVSTATPVPLRGPRAPDITSNTWLNSSPLSPADLHGKVVVVDFWTLGCYNCRNTLPYIKDWYARYHDRGLVIVGVHTPEFDYEHDVNNVQNAIREYGIPYPVALDNNFVTWNAYHVYAWPTWFVLDKQGAVRGKFVGESAYTESEQLIARLLAE
jgi:thiol-disulfide isomerase/thioredoxin